MRRAFGLVKRLLGRFGIIVRFLISGGSAALIMVAFLYLFTDIFGIWYLVSSVLAFLVAVTASFLMHKFWTFKEKSTDRLPGQAVAHVFIGLVNLGLNVILLYVFVEYFLLHYVVAQLLTSALLAIASFFVYKHKVFAHDTAKL